MRLKMTFTSYGSFLIQMSCDCHVTKPSLLVMMDIMSLDGRGVPCRSRQKAQKIETHLYNYNNVLLLVCFFFLPP